MDQTDTAPSARHPYETGSKPPPPNGPPPNPPAPQFNPTPFDDTGAIKPGTYDLHDGTRTHRVSITKPIPSATVPWDTSRPTTPAPNSLYPRKKVIAAVAGVFGGREIATILAYHLPGTPEPVVWAYTSLIIAATTLAAAYFTPPE